jgi:transposase InsO family protein
VESVCGWNVVKREKKDLPFLTCMKCKVMDSSLVLPTIDVELSDRTGKGYVYSGAEALVDSGSQICSISTEVAQTLESEGKIKPKSCKKLLKGVGGRYVQVNKYIEVRTHALLNGCWVDVDSDEDDDYMKMAGGDERYSTQKPVDLCFYIVDSGYDVILSFSAAANLKVLDSLSTYAKNRQCELDATGNSEPEEIVMSVAAMGKAWRSLRIEDAPEQPDPSVDDGLAMDAYKSFRCGIVNDWENDELFNDKIHSSYTYVDGKSTKMLHTSDLEARGIDHGSVNPCFMEIVSEDDYNSLRKRNRCTDGKVCLSTSSDSALDNPSKRSRVESAPVDSKSLLGDDCDPKDEFDDIMAFLDKKPNSRPNMEGLPRELAHQLNGICDSSETVFGDIIDRKGANVAPLMFRLKQEGKLPAQGGLRRYAAMHKEIIGKEIERLLQEFIVEQCNADVKYVADIVLVRQKEKWRVCFDYARLNFFLEDIQFPLPLIWDILDQLKGKKFLGKFDLRSGYHQFLLDEDCKHLTAFRWDNKVFNFLRVPFGLKMAPAYFQRTMQAILGDLVGKACLVYLDDIIIFGDTEAEFMRNVDDILKALAQHKIVLRGEKCVLSTAAKKLEVLGYLVSDEGVTLSMGKREELSSMEKPTTPSKLRSLNGLANYFAPFIKDYSRHMKPLTSRVNDTRLVWTEPMNTAFEWLMAEVKSLGILNFMRDDLPLILRTDASDDGVGAVLFQREKRADGKVVELPLAFMSKAFNDTEKKWSTYEQEAYAVFHGILKLQYFLKGRRFTVETDHKNLLYMANSETPKVIRWRLRLLEFDFDVLHIPGVENDVADALSRCLVIRAGMHFNRVLAAKNVVRDPPLRTSYDDKDRVERRRRMIEQCHNAIIGHGGVQRTMELVRNEYGITEREWNSSGLEQEVRAYVAACPVCQKLSKRGNLDEGDYRSTMVDYPFRKMSIDIVGPIPVDCEGNKFLIVCIDACTRIVEAKATKDCTAETCAQFLLEILSRYGPPECLFSDNGPQFTGEVIRQFLKLLKTKAQTTLAYRPQANGICERVNGEVMRHLKALLCDDGDLREKWSVMLPLATRIVNYSYHSAIDTVPARLLYGSYTNGARALIDRSGLPDSNSDVVDEAPPSERIKRLINVQVKLLKRSNEVMEELRKKSALKQNRSDTDSFDEVSKSRREKSGYREKKRSNLVPGDLVLVKYPVRPTDKLTPTWRGPLRVLEVLENGNSFRLQNILDIAKVEHIHVSRLKKYDDTQDLAEAAVLMDKGEHHIGCILDHSPGGLINKKKKSSYDFLVRWENYGPEFDLWIPYSEVRTSQALVEYLENINQTM